MSAKILRLMLPFILIHLYGTSLKFQHLACGLVISCGCKRRHIFKYDVCENWGSFNLVWSARIWVRPEGEISLWVENHKGWSYKRRGDFVHGAMDWNIASRPIYQGLYCWFGLLITSIPSILSFVNLWSSSDHIFIYFINNLAPNVSCL